MNISKLEGALQDLASAALDLANACERERIRFASFWRSVSAEASTVLASGGLDKAALERLVRDVLSAFSYQPGGFMEMYVVREDPNEQERENIVFERIRDAVRAAAGNVKQAVSDGEVSASRVRRALVDLETALLELGMNSDATIAREILNAPEVSQTPASALCDAVLRHSAPASLQRLEPLVRALKEALHPT